MTTSSEPRFEEDENGELVLIQGEEFNPADRDQIRRRGLHSFIGHHVPALYAKPIHLRGVLRNADPNASLFLQGPTGTGKTHTAWAVWRRWVMRGDWQPYRAPRPAGLSPYSPTPKGPGDGIAPHCNFWRTSRLFAAMKRAFDGGEPPHLQPGDMLVLDDIGVENPSPWVLEQLDLLIDQWYTDQAPLVVTSNLSLDELGSRIGERPASRITEHCMVVRLDGVDRRLESASSEEGAA